MPLADEALIQRIAAGERAAMQILYARHSVRVFRYVMRLVREQALAEDVTADAFLDVWQQAGRFEGRASVSTWLVGIARFKALSALRRRPHQSLDEETIDAMVDDGDDPEVAQQKRDTSSVLRQGMDRLSRDHREILDLVYYQELSIEAVGRLLDIPENTVKTRLFHARKRLAEAARALGLERGWP